MDDLQQLIFFIGVIAVAGIVVAIILYIQERKYQKRKKLGLK